MTVKVEELSALSENQTHYSFADLQQQIDHTLSKMKECLEAPTGVQFKEFWAQREICIEFFKAKLPQNIKKTLWNQYQTLCAEAKRIKKERDEESSFAIDQIELALSAIAKEFEQKDEYAPKIVTRHIPKKFERVFQESTLFMQLMVRLKDLRQEAIKTSMRVKHRTRILKNIGLHLDQLFLHRKELEAQALEIWKPHVESIKTAIEQGSKDFHFSDVKEDLKSLQTLARIMPFSAATNTLCKKQLNTLWDELQKKAEGIAKFAQEKKEKLNQHLSVWRELFEVASSELKNINPLKKEKIEEKFGSIETQVLKKIHDRDLIKLFMQEKDKYKEPFYSKIEEEEKKAEAASLEVRKNRSLQIEAIQKSSADIQNKSSLGELQALYTELTNQYTSLNCPEELLEVDFEFKEVLLASKLKNISIEKENRLILRAEIQELIKQIRLSLENIKKKMRRSGLDFLKAMDYSRDIESTRSRMERLETHLAKLDAIG